MTMGAVERDSENRRSFRCPVPEEGVRAELRIGRRRIPVQLHDESAGGFAVTAAECLDVKRSDVFQLHFDSRVFDVSLIHLFEQGPKDPARGARTYRIGLQRLGEIVAPPSAGPLSQRLLSNVLRLPSPSAHAPVSFSGVLLALVVVAAPLLFAGLFFYYYYTTLDASAEGSARAADVIAQPLGPVPAESSPGRLSLAGRASMAGAASTASGGPSSWASIARLPGAAALLASPMIRELGMSENQQRRIREIVDQTAGAFKEMDVQLRGITRQDQSELERKLLEAGREKALGLLTPEQRRRFQTLVDEPAKP